MGRLTKNCNRSAASFVVDSTHQQPLDPQHHNAPPCSLMNVLQHEIYVVIWEFATWPVLQTEWLSVQHNHFSLGEVQHDLCCAHFGQVCNLSYVVIRGLHHDSCCGGSGQPACWLFILEEMTLGRQQRPIATLTSPLATLATMAVAHRWWPKHWSCPICCTVVKAHILQHYRNQLFCRQECSLSSTYSRGRRQKLIFPLGVDDKER